MLLVEPKLKTIINIQWSPLLHINAISSSNQELIPISVDTMKGKKMGINREKREGMIKGMRMEMKRGSVKDIRRDTYQGSIQG